MKFYGLEKKKGLPGWLVGWLDGWIGRFGGTRIQPGTEHKLQKAIYYLKTRPDKDIKVLVQHNTGS